MKKILIATLALIAMSCGSVTTATNVATTSSSHSKWVPTYYAETKPHAAIKGVCVYSNAKDKPLAMVIVNKREEPQYFQFGDLSEEEFDSPTNEYSYSREYYTAFPANSSFGIQPWSETFKARFTYTFDNVDNQGRQYLEFEIGRREFTGRVNLWEDKTIDCASYL